MIRFDHPYSNLTGGAWLRGNLHTHTTRSDGARDPQVVIDDYAQRGYGYLMLSDHDKFADSALLTTFDNRGMVLLPGNEISARGVHMLQVGGDRQVEPLEDRQAVIDAGNAMDALIIVNHPNWFARFDHCTQDKLDGWRDFIGLEIYNGVIGRLDGSPYATDHWDMLLSEGRRVWGYAHDDAHAAEGDVELGWNTTYITDRTPAGVIAALREGRFYASTGVEITRIEVEGATIRVETANAEKIVALRNSGRRIATAHGPSIEFTLTDETARYVRFECWGRGESSAWTQPFYVVVEE